MYHLLFITDYFPLSNIRIILNKTIPNSPYKNIRYEKFIYYFCISVLAKHSTVVRKGVME